MWNRNVGSKVSGNLQLYAHILQDEQVKSYLNLLILKIGSDFHFYDHAINATYILFSIGTELLCQQ